MATRTIIVCGVSVTVDFDYTPYRAATFHDPAEGGDVDVNEIYIGGEEISGIVTEKFCDAVREKLEEELPAVEAEERACAEEERAERIHEERMMREAA